MYSSLQATSNAARRLQPSVLPVQTGRSLMLSITSIMSAPVDEKMRAGTVLLQEQYVVSGYGCSVKTLGSCVAQNPFDWNSNNRNETDLSMRGGATLDVWFAALFLTIIDTLHIYDTPPQTCLTI